MDLRLGARGAIAPSCEAFVTLALILLAGCASPGTPKPPSLNLPEIASALSANRMGDTVRLQWSTSGKTTDGLDVRGAMTAEICRQMEGVPPSSCTPVLRMAAKVGPVEAFDLLPSSLAQGTPLAIEYRIRILNAHGKSAGLSLPGITASGPAPPSLPELRAEATEQGVLIRWQADATAADAVELERTRPGGDHVASRRDARFGRAPEEPPVMHLQGTTEAERAGGLLDRSAKFGEPYIYTARRVQRVPVGSHTVELRSALSPQVSITLLDVFPPLAPSGLVAVSGSGFVDLSWQANTEQDLAGYLIFRKDDAELGKAVALSRDSVTIPAFRDTSVAAGHTYRYSVIAVDRAANRSPASVPVVEMVRVP